jgi:hypothetical protein
MSLKAFHIVFISVSALFFFGFGVWILFDHLIASNVWNTVAALLTFASGGLLVYYGARFLRKFKHMSYL